MIINKIRGYNNHGFIAICICDYCGKEFKRKYGEVSKRGLKRHFCSRHCFRIATCGNGNHQWVSGIFCYRKILAKYLGRNLKKYEVVHHLNGDRADNRIENLLIMSKSEHTALHNEIRG